MLCVLGVMMYCVCVLTSLLPLNLKGAISEFAKSPSLI